ncbi:MAG: 30S ribosomal protein S6 [Candidatus Omnitrophica bacterium]|nr:30S ribosomal protein S6 [Candidatus Omnitrophota bacterium]
MNRLYEAFVILKAAGTDAEVAQALAHVEEPIKKLGGQIESSKNFGRRRLAYRIARQNEGYYHLLHFRMAPEQVSELKRLLRLNEAIVRFLILNQFSEGKLMSPTHSQQEALESKISSRTAPSVVRT